MKGIETHFERFSDFIESAPEKDIPDFKGVCRIIGAPRRALDRYLKGSLGFSGEEICTVYRTSTPVFFL